MAARAHSMRARSGTRVRVSRRRLRDGLKIVLLGVLYVAVAFGIVSRDNHTLLAPVLPFAAAASLGIIVGCTSRWSIRHYPILLQMLIAFAGIGIGLLIFRLLTDGTAGLRISLGVPSEVDWEELGQILLGTSSAILALRVWSAPTMPIPQPLSKPRLRRTSSAVRRRSVRFVGAEEHRCPYCLQVVEPHDPRGVTICPICQAWHHSDCWSLTGMCQVPHNH